MQACLLNINLHFAGSLYPLVILASAVLQPFNLRHSSRSSGPAASWIAPSTIIIKILRLFSEIQFIF